MKILFVSYTFAPNLGGIETMSALLADGFAAAGHEVQVVTYTPGQDRADTTRRVHRRPPARVLWRLFAWCDVVVHSNITLRAVWPLLFLRRPWMVIHHTWIVFPDQPLHRSMLAKLAVLPAALSVCVSRALARALPVPALVIPNACDTRLFQSGDHPPRMRDIVFVGRLVSDKGVDVLLRALAVLRSRGLSPNTTILGTGAEEAPLRHLAGALGLEHVRFLGAQPADAVARELRQHRIAVVPSRWQEPFGVVVLEALACGCDVITSDAGGLPDALGACGITFPNGDAAALASAIAQALSGKTRCPPETRAAHLARHAPARIVGDYLRILSRALTPATPLP